VQETDFTRLSAIVQGMSEEEPVSLILDYAPATHISAEQIESFNAFGLARTLLVHGLFEAWGEHWEQEFIRESQRLGLLRLLGRCVASGHAVVRVPPGLLSPGKYSDRRISLAALLVRLNHANLTSTEAQDLAGWAVRLLDPLAESTAADLLFKTVETHLFRVVALESFLTALREKLPPSIELGVARCEGLLRRVVRRRPSGLQQPGQLAEFGLPNLAPSSA